MLVAWRPVATLLFFKLDGKQLDWLKPMWKVHVLFYSCLPFIWCCFADKSDTKNDQQLEKKKKDTLLSVSCFSSFPKSDRMRLEGLNRGNSARTCGEGLSDKIKLNRWATEQTKRWRRTMRGQQKGAFQAVEQTVKKCIQPLRTHTQHWNTTHMYGVCMLSKAGHISMQLWGVSIVLRWALPPLTLIGCGVISASDSRGGRGFAVLWLGQVQVSNGKEGLFCCCLKSYLFPSTALQRTLGNECNLITLPINPCWTWAF